MTSVDVTLLVEDQCDPEPAVTLISVTSSENDDASGTGDGNTVGDIGGTDTGTPDQQLYLRAERDGSGPGRVYELSYMATDASGNVAPAFATVIVPHDQGWGPEPLIVR